MRFLNKNTVISILAIIFYSINLCAVFTKSDFKKLLENHQYEDLWLKLINFVNDKNETIDEKLKCIQWAEKVSANQDNIVCTLFHAYAKLKMPQNLNSNDITQLEGFISLFRAIAFIEIISYSPDAQLNFEDPKHPTSIVKNFFSVRFKNLYDSLNIENKNAVFDTVREYITRITLPLILPSKHYISIHYDPNGFLAFENLDKEELERTSEFLQDTFLQEKGRVKFLKILEFLRL